MNKISVQKFTSSIIGLHGATAELVGRERVHETFEGETVWEGEVLVFQLLDHPEADRCYAWEVDGQVTAVLGVGPVKSASDAVRASILAGGLN